MARVTVNIPNDLMNRLTPLKDLLNMSQVCRDALQARIETYERIKGNIQNDVAESLVERMRIEKDKSRELSYTQGEEDGEQWATREASYDDLITWANMSGQADVDGVLFPHDIDAAEERFYDAIEGVSEAGRVLHNDSYSSGFRVAVTPVWDRVEDKVGVDE